MLVNDLALMVHQNAKEHGWWDEDRSLYEIIALIHSEWSEALEEARADRPNVYKLYIGTDSVDCRYITPDEADYAALHTKPEGIAVELIDGVIRILDVFGKGCLELEDPKTGEPSTFEALWGENGADDEDVPDNVAELIALLHAHTSNIIIDDEHDTLNLVQAMSMALIWIHRQGIDPLKLLMEKHEYNAKRPYKHGKKF